MCKYIVHMALIIKFSHFLLFFFIRDEEEGCWVWVGFGPSALHVARHSEMDIKKLTQKNKKILQISTPIKKDEKNGHWSLVTGQIRESTHKMNKCIFLGWTTKGRETPPPKTLIVVHIYPVLSANFSKKKCVSSL